MRLLILAIFPAESGLCRKSGRQIELYRSIRLEPFINIIRLLELASANGL